ncbi:DNA-binding protein [Corynebacterium kutscheri]|nr:DNA-binding protein [Corynebacterium kutscheri]
MDLDQLADTLGVTVVETPHLDDGLNGQYLHHRRLILLRKGLDPWTKRSTLAHELGHAWHGDDIHGDPRLERRADQFAATPVYHPRHGSLPAKLINLHIASMLDDMNFEDWLDALLAGETRAIAARKAGYAQSTITRQLSRGHLRPEMVIALCRAYDRSPVTGLIETGYLYDYETEGVAIPYALQEATNQQILDEIMRRSDPEARELFGDPTGEAIDYETHDDLAKRRHTTPEEPPHVYPFPYDEAVADTSPDEEEGDDHDYYA